MKKKFCVVMLFIILAMVLCASGAVAAEKKRIGYSMPQLVSCPYCFPFKEALEKGATALGWEFIFTDAKSDFNTQVNQIEAMVADGLDGLIIMPMDPNGIIPTIEKIYKDTGGKMPIVISNTAINPPKIDQVVCYAGPDNYTEGHIIGEYWGDYVLKNNISSINYCEITGPAGQGVTLDRTRGFVEGLKDKGVFERFHLLDSQPGDWSADKGQSIGENWITTFGDKLDMIVSQNDDMALGCALAMESAGLKAGDILMSGINGHPSILRKIKEGWCTFTVFQSARDDGQIAIDCMSKILNGEKVEYFNFIDTPPVDIGNVDEYMPIAEELWN
jgi:ABC-type sugar transport system substrate-binding protein